MINFNEMKISSLVCQNDPTSHCKICFTFFRRGLDGLKNIIDSFQVVIFLKEPKMAILDCQNVLIIVPVGAGHSSSDRIKIGPNNGQNMTKFGQFWSSSVAKSAIFRGKALHRKLARFIILNFHYWRTVESCRIYHFFQVD